MSTAPAHAAPMPKVATIFGREPAFVLGLAEAVLATLLAFAVGISQDTFGPILILVQALVGLYVAWVTRDTLLGALTGLAKAVITVIVIYGVTITDSQAAAVIALVSILGSAWNRSNTSPTYAPPEPLPGTVPVTDLAA